MSVAFTPSFVTTRWLAERLGQPGLVVVDASWHLPGSGRDAAAEYRAGHIPGAVFFPLDDIADKTRSLPHMLPAPEAFAEAVGALGIAADDTIVVYDEQGLFSAARVWWTFGVMGAQTVHILEGGGPRWRAENRPVEAGETVRAPTLFAARYDSATLADFDAVLAATRNGSAQIVDARPAARFSGESPEPRPGLKAGHIPSSRNVPFPDLVEDGALKSAEALSALFDSAGVDLRRPIVTSCGSGVSAALLGIALARAGARNIRLYDGSWAEWGSREDTEVETGRGANLP